MEVRPFTIHVPDDVLDDLRRRLGHTRFPDAIPGSGWDYGSNLEYLKALVHYWRTDFDWRAQEAQLNRLHHYKTLVDGLNIRCIHERGIGPSPMPLVMTHGWPSCFFEMTKILPFLTDPGQYGGDPADAFDLVVPSLPGFGFSDHAMERGMDVRRVAGLWNTLMTDNLGYPRFAAQGGDIGAGVTAWLGYAHADNLYGIHLTSITRPTPYLGPDARPLTAAKQALIDQRARWQQEEGGYAHIQGTKPQTLAYGLNDSPAGLAAWIVEKYHTWSDCHGDVEARFTKDELLTIVTIYWVTQETPTSGETLARTRVPRRAGRTSLHADDVVQRGMGARAGCARPAPLVSSHSRGQGCPSGDGASARKGKMMSAITVQIPDDLALALNVSPDALAPALLVAAAVKLFERGKISAGKAAELAGMPKPLFLVTLAEWGGSASTLSAEDIAQDLANA